MKTKKVYLPDGKEVELLAKYKDGDETKYVVKVAVDEDIYRNELKEKAKMLGIKPTKK